MSARSIFGEKVFTAMYTLWPTLHSRGPFIVYDSPDGFSAFCVMCTEHTSSHVAIYKRTGNKTLAEWLDGKTSVEERRRELLCAGVRPDIAQFRAESEFGWQNWRGPDASEGFVKLMDTGPFGKSERWHCNDAERHAAMHAIGWSLFERAGLLA